MQHVLKISLAHECEVDSLEEGLSCGVHRDSCLQLLKFLCIILDNLVGNLDEVLLFAYSHPNLIEFLLLLLEHCLFGCLLSMYRHEMLDHVEVC